MENQDMVIAFKVSNLATRGCAALELLTSSGQLTPDLLAAYREDLEVCLNMFECLFFDGDEYSFRTDREEFVQARRSSWYTDLKDEIVSLAENDRGLVEMTIDGVPLILRSIIEGELEDYEEYELVHTVFSYLEVVTSCFLEDQLA